MAQEQPQEPPTNEDNPGESGREPDESAARDPTPEVVDLTSRVAALTLHVAREADPVDLVMSVVVNEAPVTSIDCPMEDAGPQPHQGMPVGESLVVDNDLEMADAFLVEVFTPGQTPHMETNSILMSAGPFLPVARLDCGVIQPQHTTMDMDQGPAEPMLTTSVLTRKRSGGPAELAPAKRRQLAPVAPTAPSDGVPIARRLTPLRSKPTRPPFSAGPFRNRLRSRLFRPQPLTTREDRRRVDSDGHLRRTLFQLPQYVAQVESDRDPTPPPEAEPVATSDQPVDQGEPDEPAAPAPETPQRSWSIRGLFSSLPRSLSKFMPRIGRVPQRDFSGRPEGHGVGEVPEAPAVSEAPEASLPAESTETPGKYLFPSPASACVAHETQRPCNRSLKVAQIKSIKMQWCPNLNHLTNMTSCTNSKWKNTRDVLCATRLTAKSTATPCANPPSTLDAILTN